MAERIAAVRGLLHLAGGREKLFEVSPQCHSLKKYGEILFEKKYLPVPLLKNFYTDNLCSRVMLYF